MNKIQCNKCKKLFKLTQTKIKSDIYSLNGEEVEEKYFKCPYGKAKYNTGVYSEKLDALNKKLQRTTQESLKFYQEGKYLRYRLNQFKELKINKKRNKEIKRIQNIISLNKD